MNRPAGGIKINATIYVYPDGTLWIMADDEVFTEPTATAVRAGHEPKAMRQIKAAFDRRDGK
jgi:hypothetical protein